MDTYLKDADIILICVNTPTKSLGFGRVSTHANCMNEGLTCCIDF